MICWFPVVTVEMLILTGGDGMADWPVNCGPWPTIPGTEGEEGQRYDVAVEGYIYICDYPYCKLKYRNVVIRNTVVKDWCR